MVRFDYPVLPDTSGGTIVTNLFERRRIMSGNSFVVHDVEIAGNRPMGRIVKTYRVAASSSYRAFIAFVYGSGTRSEEENEKLLKDYEENAKCKGGQMTVEYRSGGEEVDYPTLTITVYDKERKIIQMTTVIEI